MNRRSILLGVPALALAPSLIAAGRQTPATDARPAADRIADLLAYMPYELTEPATLDLAWMDLQRQLAEFPEFDPEENLYPLFPVTIPDHLMSRGDRLAEYLGFTPWEILQSMQMGQSPHMVRLYRLPSDVSSFARLWESYGYEQVEGQHGDYWTVGEEAEVDISHPIQQAFFSHANNIAILEDNLIGMANFAADLELIQALAVGEGESIADTLEPLTIGLPEDAVNSWCVDGMNIAVTAESAAEHLAESDSAVGGMPAVEMFAVGVTAGATADPDNLSEDAVAYVSLLTAGEAEQAAEVLQWRLENMLSIQAVPFNEMFPGIEVQQVSDDIARVTVPGEAAATNRFLNMMYARDYAPFVFVADD